MTQITSDSRIGKLGTFNEEEEGNDDDDDDEHFLKSIIISLKFDGSILLIKCSL